jgi:hypothetical protein
MRLRSLAAALIPVIVAACTDATSPLAVGPPGPSFARSDGDHPSSSPSFSFLPPMVGNPGSGSNVRGLSPVVDICAWDGTACTAAVAHFTTDRSSTTTTHAGNSETVRESEHEYHVNWHTGRFHLKTGRIYRIRVSVCSEEVGFADVDVVGSGRDLKSVNPHDYVRVLDGQTLPIKFRIHQEGCGSGGTGTISGTVTACDASGCSGQAGHSVYLLDSTGTTLQTTTTTDAAGSYSFTGVPAGAHLVCEAPLGGFFEGTPSSGASCPSPYAPVGYLLTLPAGGNLGGNAFVNVQAS